MRIVVKLVPVLAFVSLGCIAQYGDPNGGPDEPTSSSTQAIDQNRAAAPTNVQRQDHTLIRELNGNPVQLENKESLGGPAAGNGGDPSQDPGDGNDPVPQPWNPHATATRAANQR